MSKYKILLLIYGFLMALVGAHAQFTEYDRTYWRDFCFINPPDNLYGDTHQFFSSAFMNESRYFVFWLTYVLSGFTPNLVISVDRYNEFCSLEASTGDVGGYAGWERAVFGNNILFYKDKLILPFGLEYTPMPSSNLVNFFIFDINKYLSNVFPFDRPIVAVKWGADINKNLITVSTLTLNKTYYSDMVSNITFAFGYKHGDRYYIHYDFYDLESGFTNTSPSPFPGEASGITIDFSIGLSDVRKFYIIPTYGRCFYWNDCLFHVLFEGRSVQNDNRYGIYVREIHRSPLWGYEFVDRGVIGIGDSIGFANGRMNIINWYYTCQYPEFCDKIYALTLEGEYEIKNRTFRVLRFSQPEYLIVRNEVINYYNNNALVSFASGTYSFFVGCGVVSACGAATTYYNVYVGNINNKTVVTGKLTASSYCYGGYGTCSAKIQFYRGGTLVNEVTASAWGSPSQPTVTSPIFGVVDSISPGYYDIGIQINCGACNQGHVEFNLDVFDSTSTFIPTKSNLGVEAFSLFPTAYETNKLMLQFPTLTFCLCGDWQFRGCYNSTHEYWTRACIPTGCSDEIRFNLNTTCAVVPPSPPPTIPPSPPFNYTAPTGALVLIPLLLGSPLFFVIVFGLALAASIEKKVNSGGIAFILTFLGVLIMFSIFSGVVPLWFVLVLMALIVGGAIYFIMRRG
jgi:hypothetical protein